MRRIIVITLGILIFIGIIALVMALEGLKNRTPDTEDGIIVPTPVRQNKQTQTAPPVLYDKEATDKLLLYVKTRPTPQVPLDTSLRQQLIDSLGGKTGTLLETQNFKLEYVKEPNDFEVEIKTADVTTAKLEAISFFKDKGFTNDGICKLPLMYYLNTQTAKSYRQTGQKFSPIPDFCI